MEAKILKPCPICGNTVIITEVNVGTIYNRNRHDLYAKIECRCGLTFEHEWTEAKENGVFHPIFGGVDITTAWNRRASDENT